MAGYSRVKAPRTRPHDNNDDLSSLYSRPSIQNSSHWPSVNLRSPDPSVRTLNQSDGGTYRDDILSLANFASEDIDPSVRDSVLTASMSASPSSNRASTPSGSFRGKYQHLPVSLETSGESRRSYSSVSSLVDNVIKDLPRQSALTDTALVPPLQSTPNDEHPFERYAISAVLSLRVRSLEPSGLPESSIFNVSGVPVVTKITRVFRSSPKFQSR
ncbi:hypothetical protein V8E53_006249 [Lactarius tabidus]